VALITGYTWAETFTLAPDATYFPDGVALRAQVREKVDGAVLATLTTADGTLERLSNASVRVTIPAGVSRDWTIKAIVFDLARTDVTPDTHLGFLVKVAVRRPVTVTTDATPP
jgi:hypothetical protein